jgi:hypothetical protein
MAARAVAVVLVLTAAVACGDAGPSGSAGTTMVPGDRWAISGDILDNGGNPQLCDAVNLSDPPSCLGLELVGFGWDHVDGETSNDGVTEGHADLVGVFEGDRFRVLDYDGPDVPNPDAAAPPELEPACEEPSGDPEAGPADDILGVVGPSLVVGYVTDGERVLNVVVQPGHAVETEAAIRTGYQGLLCVAEREGLTQLEVFRLYDEITQLGENTPLGAIWSSAANELDGRVDVTALALTDDGRIWAEQQWGDDVHLTSRMQRVD